MREDGPDYTGVWVQERKIASIGVHVQRGVTTHGLAVNVNNDLEPFSWITPCGLQGVQMTSLQRELGRRRALAPRASAGCCWTALRGVRAQRRRGSLDGRAAARAPAVAA